MVIGVTDICGITSFVSLSSFVKLILPEHAARLELKFSDRNDKDGLVSRNTFGSIFFVFLFVALEFHLARFLNEKYVYWSQKPNFFRLYSRTDHNYVIIYFLSI